MEGGFKRVERVNQLLQEELGALLVNGVMDPRVGFVTVTEVRCADDLRSARVYVSVYGSDEQREQSLAGLQDAAGFLRRELKNRIRLRHIPQLTFAQDTTLDQAMRLEALLHAAKEGAADAPGEGESEVVPVHTDRSALADTAQELAHARAEKQQQRRATQQEPGQRSRRSRTSRRGGARRSKRHS